MTHLQVSLTWLAFAVTVVRDLEAMHVPVTVTFHASMPARLGHPTLHPSALITVVIVLRLVQLLGG